MCLYLLKMPKKQTKRSKEKMTNKTMPKTVESLEPVWNSATLIHDEEELSDGS